MTRIKPFKAGFRNILFRSGLLIAATSLLLVGGAHKADAAAPRSGKRAPRSDSAPRSAAQARKPAVSRTPQVAANLKRIVLAPTSAEIDGSRGAQRLLVMGYTEDGATVDLTGSAAFKLSRPGLVKIENGTARPVADGEVQISAVVGSHRSDPVQIKVTNAAAKPEIQFVNDIMPILAKTGCNSTACHGSPVGKGDFKLSLFGYEPELDHPAIVKASGGRRIDMKSPAKSLLLTKPSGGTSHGGGVRFKPDSPEYRLILAWITAGAPGLAEFEAQARRIVVMPDEPYLPAAGARQRLAVTAFFSDGTSRDVTDQALYTSNDDAIAAVDGGGVVTALRPGETAVMVRFLGQVGVARMAVLQPRKPVRTYRVERVNYIDRHVQNKLDRLRMIPALQCSDEEFLRRAMLDVCGIIPTPDEIRAFMADRSAGKRQKLIDDLLRRDEHVDLWTMRWNDILRNNPRQTRLGTAYYSDWIREQIASNRPYDQWVRELIASRGKSADIELTIDNLPPQLKRRRNAEQVARLINSIEFNPAANYYVVSRDPLDVAAATSQVFLGVRVECARCHNHPFEKWTQEDFYGLAGYWNGLQVRAQNQAPGIVTFNENARTQRHPKTNEPVEPRPLDGAETSAASADDPRSAIAGWMTSPDNPYFARAIVNRIWAHYFGRGIVEPVDDFRVTNPASNPELLDALAADLVEHKFDLRHTHRMILNSWTYQQSSRPNEYNRSDVSNFARYYPKRMMAEQLYDSISQATGVYLVPPGAGRRLNAARQALKKSNNLQAEALESALPTEETRRVMQLPAVPSGGGGRRTPGEVAAFLDAFGKPKREVVCECERTSDGNLGQALLLMNSEDINRKIASPGGRVQDLVRRGAPSDRAVEEIFLAVLGRLPDQRERGEALALLKSAGEPAAGYQDLMASLLNTREFLFIH